MMMLECAAGFCLYFQDLVAWISFPVKAGLIE